MFIHNKLCICSGYLSVCFILFLAHTNERAYLMLPDGQILLFTRITEAPELVDLISAGINEMEHGNKIIFKNYVGHGTLSKNEVLLSLGLP